MNARQLISALVILMFSFSLQAQNETILFGQQKAINNLSKDAGVSSKELDDYLKKRYQRPLYQLTQSEGADIIKGFQDGRLSRNSISDYLRPAVQATNNTQSQSSLVKKEDLIAASVLEVGMKKRFHFKDGSISEGEIINLEEDLVVLVTASGEFRIPKGEFLAETAEITNKKGEKFVGHVLSETEEEFVIRTQYGDAKIHKREIEKMSRFHGGVKDPKTEMTKRFYMGEASLLSVFLDPTANVLAPNTFYISGMSLGYGLTDKFQMTTKYASNFNGDLNLHPRLRFMHKKTADKERSMSIGLGFHRSYPMSSIIGKYAHAVKVNTSGDSTINQFSELELKDVMKNDPNNNDNNPVYVEAYLVYTSHRINPTGRGKVGWTVGGKVSNAFSNNIQDELKTGYTFDKDNYKIPYRLWASLDYDLRKDLKFVASTWIDNGYRSMDAGQAFEDYIGSDDSTPLSIDSIRGKKSLFDFDFGLLYAPTENFRIGVHFQQPFIDFYWEFFEF
jgi:RNase P/RNase MRP subunit p29